MIYGIGTDITDVKRFDKWVKNPEMINRFFNDEEKMHGGSDSAKNQHYAVRFAAKEAFSKALGTGLIFDLKDVFIIKNQDGKPYLKIENMAKKLLDERCKDAIVHVSLSHEKDYATAFVIIEGNTENK